MGVFQGDMGVIQGATKEIKGIQVPISIFVGVMLHSIKEVCHDSNSQLPCNICDQQTYHRDHFPHTLIPFISHMSIHSQSWKEKKTRATCVDVTQHVGIHTWLVGHVPVGDIHIP